MCLTDLQVQDISGAVTGPYCDLLGKMLRLQVGNIFDEIIWVD